VAVNGPVGYWVPRQPPRAKYVIDSSLEVGETFCLKGTEAIRFVNTTAKPMQTLAITWFRAGEQTMEIVANGRRVALPTPVTSFPQAFVLAEPVGPGETVELAVEFRVSLPAPGSVPERLGPVDEWPHLWWGFETQDDYDVRLDVPDAYSVIVTSGRLDSQTGRYRAEAVPSFGFFLCKGHEVMEGQAGDVLVRCIYKPEHKECATLLHETAIDVINFYREWLGFYPYDILTIIPGMDRPAGGYPVATNIVSIHGMGRMEEKPELHWRWITAHEIGHQYWSRYVMEKDRPGWLWIGLGIYADREYCRARGLGNDKHRELMERYIRGVREGLDTTVSRSQEEEGQIKFDFNNVVIHGKGFSIISALDCLMGHEVFERAYQRCLREFAGQRFGEHELRAVCEEESGEELGWFFDQWVNSSKFLSYEITEQRCEEKDGGYVTTAEVKCQGDLQMPVPVVARFADGSSQRAFTNRLREEDTVRFVSDSKLEEVRIDPEGALPMVVPPPPRPAMAISKLPWVGAGEAALDAFKQAQEGKLSDAGKWLKLGMALYDGKYYTEALEAFREMQTQAANGSSAACAALVWQGHLLDLLDRRDEALKCYKEAMKNVDSLDMRHDQYKMRLNRQWVEKRLKEPFVRQ
jgi:tetratricopeptide (TPR) repeat protein